MSASLISADIKLAEAVIFTLGAGNAGHRVEFQFPPKIASDSRRATWQEREYAGQVEPIVVLASAGPRTLTMQITYIYDGEWDSKKISNQVRAIRGYFQRVRDRNFERNMLIQLKIWGIGGQNPLSFRMKSCDVKYSETMIYNNDANDAYPLRTDITCDLASWTKDNISDNARKTTTQDLAYLSDKLTPEWY